ncbi:hypothetical protein [Papillibacter cinnamivorans]|nr:hypothetical protein [Papillibacter cinnamivorans]
MAAIATDKPKMAEISEAELEIVLLFRASGCSVTDVVSALNKPVQ